MMHSPPHGFYSWILFIAQGSSRAVVQLFTCVVEKNVSARVMSLGRAIWDETNRGELIWLVAQQ
jgi:hypothetical protein